MRVSCRECNYLNDWCSEHCRTYKEPEPSFKQGQYVEFTQDIFEGYVVHALKGDAGEIEKAYGNRGCEWIVYTTRGTRLKVNESQIKH